MISLKRFASHALVVALTATIIATLLQIAWDTWKSRSNLTVEVVSVATIVQSKILPELEFRYRGRRISELSQVVLTIRNDGRTPLTAEDVVAPLTITIGKTPVVDARVIAIAPKNIDPSLALKGNAIEIGFPLLNPGDSFQLNVLSQEASPSVSSFGRIRGISEVVQIGVGGPKPVLERVLPSVLLVCMSLLFLRIAYVHTLFPARRSELIEDVRGEGEIFRGAQSREDAKQIERRLSLFLGEDRGKVGAWFDLVEWPLGEQDLKALKSKILPILEGGGDKFGFWLFLALGVGMLAFSVLQFFGFIKAA